LGGAAILLAAALAACGGPGKTAAPEVRVVTATLDDLSCPNAASCTAVGSFLPVDTDATSGDPDGDGDASHALVESFDGRRWRVAATPRLRRGGGILSGVSCAAAGSCVAVGYDQANVADSDDESAPPRSPVAFALRAGRWSAMTLPAVARNSVLLGVACAAPTWCLAVGYSASAVSADRFLERPLVEELRGGRWRVAAALLPAGGSVGLTAVACASEAACVAVGTTAPAATPTATRPLLEQLEGAAWRAPPLPPAARARGLLDAVTCPAARSCIAAGDVATGHSAGSALVVRDGAAGWVADAPVLAEPGQNTLTAVACASAARCLVTGLTARSEVDRPRLLVAALGTAGWQEVDTAESNGYVERLACAAAAECLLVGNDGARTFNAELSDAGFQPLVAPVP